MCGPKDKAALPCDWSLHGMQRTMIKPTVNLSETGCTKAGWRCSPDSDNFNCCKNV